MIEIPKPCACGSELIGLSDGSSVYGWQCKACSHRWPRNISTRGMWRFRMVCSDDPRLYDEPMP